MEPGGNVGERSSFLISVFTEPGMEGTLPSWAEGSLELLIGIPVGDNILLGSFFVSMDWMGVGGKPVERSLFG